MIAAASTLLADDAAAGGGGVMVRDTHLLGRIPSLRKDQTGSMSSECSNDSSLTLSSMRQALEFNPSSPSSSSSTEEEGEGHHPGKEDDVLVRDDDFDTGSDDDDDCDEEGEEEEGVRRRQHELEGTARDVHTLGSLQSQSYPQTSSSSLFLSEGEGLHNRRLSSTVCNVEHVCPEGSVVDCSRDSDCSGTINSDPDDSPCSGNKDSCGGGGGVSVVSPTTMKARKASW